jgi:hypothetical protein
MKSQSITARALAVVPAAAGAVALWCALFAHGAAAAQDAQQQQVDKRKLTTVQTAAADCGDVNKAVVVRYLNLPFGEATFNYVETGKDPANGGYYSGRTWPIAHLRLAAPATHEGKLLAPGDYVIYLTPRDPAKNSAMTLSVASFKPAQIGGTFLKAGDVFLDTPKDAQVVTRKTVKFARGASKVDELQVWVGKQNDQVDIKFHYGDRTLVETLKLK